jgi:hypothetical protein
MVNVFSFCLYGPPNPRYYPIPMIQNIELVQKHFPNWKVYLYVSPDVDLGFLQQISQYSNVVLKPTGKIGDINRLERLFAIDEPDVETMFVRDADSRIHWKDRWAINDFLSKPRFIAHVIRDNREHNAAMLAGLWGIHKSSGISVKTLFKEYLKHPIDLGFGISGMDQSFLITYIYPLIKSKLLAHTSNNQQFSGEHNVTFPFVYTDQIHCGKVDGPEFIDENFGNVTQLGRRILVNGRFKL